jgi:hypothetical protein
MLKKTFQVSDDTTTYPVICNWDDLDEEQKEACYQQGYAEDHYLFWFIGTAAFSFEGDLHSLQGVFECFGDYSYYLDYRGSTYLAKFNVVNGFTASITLAKIEEVQE